MYKGFMQDFRIAEVYGVNAVKDTFNRAFEEWKDNVEYFASLVMTLNHLIWYWYEVDKDHELAKLYDELWKKADAYGCEYFAGEDAEYYYSFLD